MDSLFRAYKLSKMPGILSMNDAQIRNLEIKMDREDILEFLNGRELCIMECNVDEVEKIDISEIVEALLLYHEQIKKYGPDEYLLSLQRNGRLNSFENPAAELVAGHDIDFAKVRSMPEKVLRPWIISYLEMLRTGRWENEKLITFKGHHGGL